MLNLPYLVSPALLLGPWLISVPFPQRWVRRRDPGAPSRAAFCSFVTRDALEMRTRQARPCASFPFSPGAVVLLRCFALEHPPLLPRIRGGLWGRFTQH